MCKTIRKLRYATAARNFTGSVLTITMPLCRPGEVAVIAISPGDFAACTMAAHSPLKADRLLALSGSWLLRIAIAHADQGARPR